METKKKSGRDYLKEKIAKLEAEIVTLNDQVKNAEHEHDKRDERFKSMQKKYEDTIAEMETKAKAAAKEYDIEVKEHQALEKKYQKALEDISDKDASYLRLKKELNQTIDEQAKTISKLTTEKACMESDAKFYKSMSARYWEAMGCVRRWWYERKQM